jgi:hypothetical protein
MRKLTNDEFLSKCKELHGDRYDYSKTNYINTRTKIIIYWQFDNIESFLLDLK